MKQTADMARATLSAHGLRVEVRPRNLGGWEVVASIGRNSIAAVERACRGLRLFSRAQTGKRFTWF